MERIDKWMLESMQKWYKKESWGDSFAYALGGGPSGAGEPKQVLADVAPDRKLPGSFARPRFSNVDV